MKNVGIWATLIAVVLAITIAVIIFLVEKKKSEDYEAPKKFLQYGNYHFYDYGLGTKLYQSDWTRGSFFQPFVPLDQGLYTTDEWSPRYIKHDDQYYKTCTSCY